MRTSDIWQAKQNPPYVRTERMYLDKDKPLEELTLDELRAALCGKANGDVLACEACEAKCKFGRRIVDLLKPVEKEKKTMKNEVQVMAMNAKRREKRDIAYMSAIASGDPKTWFITNGREIKNSMKRLKTLYGSVTQEEAVRWLADKGIVTEGQKEAVSSEVIEAAQEAVMAKPSLKITQLAGEFFTYSLSEDGLSMDGRAGAAYVELSKVSSMCEEIAKVAQLLKNGITL